MKNINSVELLPPVILRCGYIYKLLKRIDNVSIYEAYNDEESLSPAGYFTIFIRQKKASTFPDGRHSPAQELFPPKSKGGTDAEFFMFDDGNGIERAEKKFDEMLEKRCPQSFNQERKGAFSPKQRVRSPKRHKRGNPSKG